MGFLSAIPIIGSIIDKAFGVIDKAVEDKDLANKLKQEIQVLFTTKEYDTIQKELDAQTQIIVAEAQGASWLQRNWRPVLMLTFTFIIAWNYILAPIIGMFAKGMVTLQIPPDMWDLLKLGIGGYIVGRSAEKIVKDYKAK